MLETQLESDIRKHLIDGKLPCVLAHRMAANHKISPLDVGAAADRLDLRISCCQLGLFGYGAFGAKQASMDVKAIPSGSLPHWPQYSSREDSPAQPPGRWPRSRAYLGC